MLIRERDEILSKINQVIEAERGTALREDQLLTESGMDSFSYAVFWLEMEDIGVNWNDEFIDKLDYSTLTIGSIIDKIEVCDHEAH